MLAPGPVEDSENTVWVFGGFGGSWVAQRVTRTKGLFHFQA